MTPRHRGVGTRRDLTYASLQRPHGPASRSAACFALPVLTRGRSMNLGKRCAAEFFGTFWLVLGGCGSAVLAA